MVTIDDVRQAMGAVYSAAHVTPLLHPLGLSHRFGAPVFLKAECLQHTGSFKVRGAANRLAALTPGERARGVIAASAGNHAQGVAATATAIGVPATVVMPEGAPLAKLMATREYGANVIIHGAGFGEAAEHALALAEERGLTYIPAFDDGAVIAGQGTLGIEIAEQRPDARLVLVPVGGGGLAAGAAIALKSLLPHVRIVGVQAAASPAAARSFAAGSDAPLAVPVSPTIADGIAVPQPGHLTTPLLRRHLDDIVTVDEEAILQAIVLLLERAKLVVEGAGAVGLAALISGTVKAQDPTVVVLSGGNIDINFLSAVVQHGLLHAGRYFTLTVRLNDHPGTLAALLQTIGRAGANVVDIDHRRQGVHLPVRVAEVRLLLETRDAAHAQTTLQAVIESGYTEATALDPGHTLDPASWRQT